MIKGLQGLCVALCLLGFMPLNGLAEDGKYKSIFDDNPKQSDTKDPSDGRNGQHTRLIINALIHNGFGVEASNGKKMCRDDGYCSFHTDPSNIVLIVRGRGLVQVSPSDETKATDYVKVCGLTLSALTTENVDFSYGMMLGALEQLQNQKQVGLNLKGVDFKLYRDKSTTGIPTCEFFKLE